MKFFKQLLVIIGIAIFLNGCSWFSSSTNSINQPLPLKNISTQQVSFKQKWTNQSVEGAQSPYDQLNVAVHENIVYVPGGYNKVVALSLKDGKVLWKSTIKGVSGITAGVVYDQGKLYIASVEGKLIALSAKNGKILWQHFIGAQILARPAVGKGYIAVNSIDGSLTVLQATSGQLLWTRKITVPALTLRGDSSPVIFQNVVLSGFADGSLRIFNLENGDSKGVLQLSEAKAGSALESLVDIDTTPLVIGSSVYVANYQGDVVAIDLTQSQIKWKHPFSTVSRSLDDGFGSVYAVNTDDEVLALDMQDGTVVWTNANLKYRKLNSPVVWNNYIILGDDQGYIHVLSQVNGAEVGRLKVSSGLSAKAQIVDKQLIILDHQGKVSVYYIKENHN